MQAKAEPQQESLMLLDERSTQIYYGCAMKNPALDGAKVNHRDELEPISHLTYT